MGRTVSFKARALHQSSSGVLVSLEAKSLFFDRPGVVKAIGKKRARMLARLGAFIRTTARTAVLRRRKKPSMPGQPPSVHSKDGFATFRNILFAASPDGYSVLVGPVAIKSLAEQHGDDVEHPAPAVHEHAKQLKVRQSRRRGVPDAKWRRSYAQKPDHAHFEYRTVHVQYPLRKFMGPAMLLTVKSGKVRQSV